MKEALEARVVNHEEMLKQASGAGAATWGAGIGAAAAAS